mmetsp:Transcript_76241/g.210396  ORF Transcript_76241/g.210396 Transcript_76241/m.210396 type:complete len:535 (-) Transcript_76241:216-1820(-)
MIKYDAGQWGLFYVIRYHGSVFPKALLWALPNAILAVVLHMYCRKDGDYYVDQMSMEGVNIIWGGYTSVLGFLVVFRNNQAYTRFWEGATLINQVRGEWFNAVSTLFAFCNHQKEYADQVKHFQHILVRLASMLYCSALQQVCDLHDDKLEIVNNEGMDSESKEFMLDSNDRCEIILQWIQRLIVDSEENRTIKIAPPLLTRAFQELSRGIVNLNNARKIKDIPFPFPYAQMITCMLLVHWMVTPLMASQVIESRIWAGVMCFFVTFSFWCLIYIALEIDQPFGEDANDLPIRDMQRDFNQSLLRLLEPAAQKVPTWQVRNISKPELGVSDSAQHPRGTIRVTTGSDASLEDSADGSSMRPLGHAKFFSEGARPVTTFGGMRSNGGVSLDFFPHKGHSPTRRHSPERHKVVSLESIPPSVGSESDEAESSLMPTEPAIHPLPSPSPPRCGAGPLTVKCDAGPGSGLAGPRQMGPCARRSPDLPAEREAQSRDASGQASEGAPPAGHPGLLRPSSQSAWSGSTAEAIERPVARHL